MQHPFGTRQIKPIFFADLFFLVIFVPQYRGVEQLAARWAHNPKVGGSSPPPATKYLKELVIFTSSLFLDSDNFWHILFYFFSILVNKYFMYWKSLFTKHIFHAFW